MCDQTEVSYAPGDVVWVKLGPVWWPGKVCKSEDIPSEIMKGLRKEPIAIVKFFQEDTYEYVKKLTNIYHYNCFKKNEFIKKGLDMCRSKNNRDLPSNMKLFPKDVATAELLTGGNPDILHDEMFLPEEKPSIADMFQTTKRTPKKVKVETKKEPVTLPKQIIPRVITHPRFIRLSLGMNTDYEVRERKQEPARPESDEEDITPPTTYQCSECDFTTIRLNVIVLHYKSHTRNYVTTNTLKTVKKRSSAGESRKRPSVSNEYKDDVVKEKIAKTNGTAKPSKSTNKCRKSWRKKKIEKPALETEEKKNVQSASKPIVKKKKQTYTDEFQNSLLEDWAEYEMAEQECDLKDSTLSSDESNDSKNNTLSVTTNERKLDESKKKSCFDFDDSEDNIVIDKTKIKFGRKIPRVLDEVRIDSKYIGEPIGTEIDNQSKSVECQNENALNLKVTSLSDSYTTGVNDAPNETFLNTQQTQLQEMGVDNEVEINSEDISEVHLSGTEDELNRSEHDRNDTCYESSNSIVQDIKNTTESNEPENKKCDVEEFCKKVNKLLDEVSTPCKLPILPKKMYLKSFKSDASSDGVFKHTTTEQDRLTNNTEIQNETISLNNDINRNSADIPVVKRDESTCLDIKNSTPESHSAVSATSNVTQATENLPDQCIVPSMNETKILTTEGNIVSSNLKETPVKTLKVGSNYLISPAKIIKINPKQFTCDSTQYKSTIRGIAKNNVILTAVSEPKNQTVPQTTLINTKLKTIDGKNIVYNSQPVLLSNQQPSQNIVISNTKPSVILEREFVAKLLNRQIVSTTNVSKSSTIVYQNRSVASPNIDLTNAKVQKVRLGPNILHKSIPSRASVTQPISKSPTKNISIPSSSLQSGSVVLLQSHSNKPQLLLAGLPTDESAGQVVPTASQAQPELMYLTDDGESYQVVNTASTNVAQPLSMSVNLNQPNSVYITVDSSGNIVNVPEISTPANTCVATKEDILAKALENTDVLQTEEIALANSSTVLDSLNVTRNTSAAYKGEVYESLTLNTPPIMSAYETPSRILNSAPVGVSNEMIIISEKSAETNQYID